MFLPINIKAMSSADHNPKPFVTAESANANASARLAHELSNLLDGSLRNVGLVLRTLSQGETVAADARSEEALTQRLAAAREAMQQMAQLIHRWMRESRSIDSLYQHTRTLGESLGHTVALCQPTVEELGIHIIAEVSPQAANLPAGPLDPVVLNMVRNSLEAMAEMDAVARRDGRIAVTAEVIGCELALQVIDTGPGIDPLLLTADGSFRLGVTTKPMGHGLGLTLAGEIVRSMGGTFDIRNGDGRGAHMTVRVPIAALLNPGDGI